MFLEFQNFDFNGFKYFKWRQEKLENEMDYFKYFHRVVVAPNPGMPGFNSK